MDVLSQYSRRCRSQLISLFHDCCWKQQHFHMFLKSRILPKRSSRSSGTGLVSRCVNRDSKLVVSYPFIFGITVRNSNRVGMIYKESFHQ